MIDFLMGVYCRTNKIKVIRYKEDFEAMKRKTKGILIEMIVAVAGVVTYKATH